MKCHNRSATVTTSSTGREFHVRQTFLAGVTPEFELPYASRFVCIHILFVPPTQDVKRPPRTRHEAPLFLAKNYFYLVFVVAHSSRRPPPSSPGWSDNEWQSS